MYTFSERMSDLVQEAMDYVHDVLQKRGTNYELIDPQEIEESNNLPDRIYTLPRISEVKKHGYYVQYAITAINIKDDKLLFEATPLTEGVDDDQTFTEDDPSSEQWLAIADAVAELEK